MASGGVAFTKAMQPVGFGNPPIPSARAADVGVDEAYAALPFTTTGTASAEEVAQVSIDDTGTHWLEAGTSPSATAGVGIPVQGPGTYHVSLAAGDKLSIAV